MKELRLRSIWTSFPQEIIPRLVKPGIVIIVLFLAFYIGMQPNSRFAFLGTFFVGGLIPLILLVRRLEIGLIAIIPVSFLLKLELGTGTNVPLNAAILMTAGLLGLWIFRMIVIDRSVFLFRTKVNKSALLFILATTMSLIFGNADWFIWAEYKASLPAQIGGWMLYTIPIGILLFTGNCLKNQQSLKRMVYLFLILGGIIILSRVPASTYQPILKYFVHSSQGAMLWLWLAALAVGQLLFNQSMAWKWRILLIILVASLLATNWMYGRKEWVSGWLPPLVAMFVIIWLRSWKMGILLTTTSGLAILLNYSLLNSEVMTDAQQYSTYSRFATLPIMFELFKASPLFGLGPANYHFYTPLYSLLGWQVQFNSHNNYVDILVQTGIVGMVIFMWLVIEIAKLTWRLRALTQDGFLSGYLAAAMGGLVGMLFSGLLGDWFLPFLYNIGIPGFRASIFAWIFLGGVIAIERFLNQPGVVVESS